MILRWWRGWLKAMRVRQANRLLTLLERGDPALGERFRRVVSEAAGLQVASPTDADGRPRTDRLSLLLRELPLTMRNVKILAAHLAQQRATEVPEVPVPRPRRIGLTGRVCRQVDIERPWMRHWFPVMGARATYHRKSWESAFVLQALWEAGMLAPGRRGLGFAVGREPLPSILAARGAEVLATDLDAGDARAESWSATHQNAARVEDLFRPKIVDRETFLARCAFRAVDMNAIPADLAGGFDFVWSTCSFEHLGSISRGLDFVVAAMDCLKPGGVAVHTTEFRLDGQGPRLDNWGTVLFARQDMEALAARLAARGHRMAPIDYGPGHGVLDHYVDVPPFGWQITDGFVPPLAPHLRLSVDGIPATSIGLIIQAAGGDAAAAAGTDTPAPAA
jgi:SAM-dependent methyltransferase